MKLCLIMNVDTVLYDAVLLINLCLIGNINLFSCFPETF